MNESHGADESARLSPSIIVASWLLIWPGGLRDRVSREPYSRETLQSVFSATKGITALAANMLADRGQLDLDAPVAAYWPEFAQADKSEIPVRWLLTHQSGVLGLDRTISLEQLMDWSLVVELLATPMEVNRRDVRAAEIPAANGIANALSFAQMFAAIIDEVDGVRCLSSGAMNLARLEQWRGPDMVMGMENAVGLGFLLPTEWCPLGGPGSFGAAGFGGSRAWANPELELAFAYVPNLCSLGHFDAREAALSRAAVMCATRIRAKYGANSVESESL